MALVDVYVDGLNVTQYVDSGSVTHRLNRPAVGQIRCLSQLVSITDKSKIKVVLDGALDIHGTVEGTAALEVDGDEDAIWTTAQFADAMTYLDTRRAMDADGDYSNPTFMYDFSTGPAIVQQIVQNTISQIGSLPLSLGSFASGGANLSGAPTNWPMMISEVIALLTDTGECDVVCQATDAGGKMGVLSAYNGNFGTDRSASVRFEYKTGSYNASQCRMTSDKSVLANRIRYLLGPRRKTAADPGSLQHWDGSIDRTTVAQLPDPPQSTIEFYRAQSELDYGIREDTRIFDAQGDSSVLPRALYLRHWQREAWVRLKPKVMVQVTPRPGIEPSFGIGDLITVSAGPEFNGGFSGVQRVMEYTYSFDSNGVVQLGAPQGQEGASAVSTTSANEGIS